MDVIARIDEARRRWDVLEHPFYERWSAGRLTREELARYAEQYRHAVVALAHASERVVEQAGPPHADGLRRHAAEERAHVQLWDRFAQAMGAASGEQPARPQTEECAKAWTAGADALERLAVLYAIEASQPEISKTKLEGLTERYGYAEEGPATEYFRLHATLDAEHARQASELIAQLMSEDEEQASRQADTMLARAEAALRGNWTLLDGVDA